MRYRALFGNWIALVLMVILILGGVGVLAPPAKATPLPPGAFVLSSPLTLSPGSLMVADASGFASAGPGFPILDLFWHQSVFSDPLNPLGGLTWIFQAQNLGTSTTIIERITLSDFSGFILNAGHNVGPLPPGFFGGGTVLPSFITRSLDGSVPAYNFLLDPIDPSQWTMPLEIQTNGPLVVPGTFTFQNGKTVSVGAFALTVPHQVPEPSSLGMLAASLLGLFLVGGIGKRHRRARSEGL